MDISDEGVAAAERRMRERVARYPRAIGARYDRRRGRIVVRLDTGVELTFAPRLAQGLADGAPDQLARIEITPLGDGLHWPDLDADLFVPSLLEGTFGSKAWTARRAETSGAHRRSRRTSMTAQPEDKPRSTTRSA
jgi:hypothetical protein